MFHLKSVQKMLTNKEAQVLVMLELCSHDPYSEHEPLLTEDEENSIYDRYTECQGSLFMDWKYILKPIKDPNTRDKFISLLEKLDEEDDV